MRRAAGPASASSRDGRGHRTVDVERVRPPSCPTADDGFHSTLGTDEYSIAEDDPLSACDDLSSRLESSSAKAGRADRGGRDDGLRRRVFSSTTRSRRTTGTRGSSRRNGRLGGARRGLACRGDGYPVNRRQHETRTKGHDVRRRETDADHGHRERPVPRVGRRPSGARGDRDERCGRGRVVARDRDDLASPDRYMLCRCGHSCTKPFCDGTHARGGLRRHRERWPESTTSSPACIDGPGVKLQATHASCAQRRGSATGQAGLWNLIESCDDPEVRALVLGGGRTLSLPGATRPAIR